MEIHGDFERRAVVHGARMAWEPSPMAGVERRMLDRVGGEVARATSLVRYAPGSDFAPHTHDRGEELFVLEGVFQDEHGDFPVGSYVRNPPGSSHTPRSEPGCTILVKLRQMRMDDQQTLRLDTGELPWEPGSFAGVELKRLYDHPREHVRLECWAPGTEVGLKVADGLELFVLDGGFEDPDQFFEPWSWIRMPAGSRFQARTRDGVTLWVKDGRFENVLAD